MFTETEHSQTEDSVVIVQIISLISLLAFLLNRALGWFEEEVELVKKIRKTSSLVFWILFFLTLVLILPSITQGGIRPAETAFLFFCLYFIYILVLGFAIRIGLIPPADIFQKRRDAFETLMLYAGTPSVTALVISLHFI